MTITFANLGLAIFNIQRKKVYMEQQKPIKYSLLFINVQTSPLAIYD